MKAYMLNMDKATEENFSDPNEFNVPPLTHSLHIQWPLINLGGKWHLVMENGACYQQALEFWTKLYKDNTFNVTHPRK